MVREICKDVLFLARKSEPATPDDLPVAADLLETLEAHADGCVGMAANMIGVARRIIAFDDEGIYRVLFNPEIVKKSGPYEAEEGCLSLTGPPKGKALENHQGAVSGRAVPGAVQDLDRLARPDHPARDRPL